ncbi:MAG: NADH-quinone oxidoreductase subunit J [Bacteroidota bacterium]
MILDTVIFYLLGSVAIASALLMVTRRNPVISVIFLILNFFCLAGLYLTLHAQFIAIVQIIVYAGAIMVLFLFVIMLLNLGNEDQLREKIGWKKIVAIGLGVALALEVLYIVGYQSRLAAVQSPGAVEIGTVESIGRVLFSEYLFPFEVTSLLLVAAIMGAIVLAKKKFE